MVHPDLLKILACPACQGEVEFKDGQILCRKCGRRYPVRNDIPIMLIDEAVTA